MAMIRLFNRTIFFLCILLLSTTPAFSATNPVTADYKAQAANHILVLHSYHPGFPWTDHVMGGIQDVLSDSLEQIHMDVEYLDVKRHRLDIYSSRMRDAVMHQKLKNRSFNLVIASGNEALQYALDNRAELFESVPIVSCGIAGADTSSLSAEGHTSVSHEPDFEGVIRQALAFHPKASKMIVIGSTHDQAERLNSQHLMAVSQTFDKKITFDFWNDVPAETIIVRLRNVAADTILLVNGSIWDRAGNLLSFYEQTGLLRQTHLPLYSFWDVFLGEGIVGGPLLNMREQGRIAASTALQILNGKQETHVSEQKSAVTPIFDYRELQRLGIAPDRLPADRILLNDPQPFYKLSESQLLWSGTFLFSAIIVILLLTRNILLRRQAETQLRNSEQNYRQLAQQFQIVLDGIPDSLTLISKEMKVIWSNKGTDKYFRKSSEATLEEFCCNLLYNRTSICDNCPAIKAFQSGVAEESTITTPDDRTLEVKAFPVRDGSDEISYVIMLACDITEKNRLYEEAARTRRLVALGELAAGVAHEINNPNALILLNAELLKKACCDAAPILQRYYEESGEFKLAGFPYSEMCCELPHLFAEMFESAGRIKSIVSDLKDFALADDQNLREIIDLNLAVEQVVRLVANTIKSATDNFNVELAQDLPPFVGNQHHIEQVLANLIINACQALPDREKGIHVSTCYLPERKSCVITVRDEGVGISKENMPHITDPFFTTKRQSGGTGLGLSVSMRIVKNYGGTLEFHSELGKGTNVYLYLPVEQEVTES
ncbi:MAG: ATP-binding protein [Geobacteraceae bacterium]|nr:ATP-binding protein [Geobacteraceae bacterium]